MGSPTTFRPHLEILESRELLAGLQAYVAAGNLYVLGTPNNDFINIAQNGSQVSVSNASINVNGRYVASIDAATVAKIMVYGNAGGDFINLATVKGEAHIYGGAGNDIIRCGTGNQTVINDGGFDSIFHPFKAGEAVINGDEVTDLRQGFAPVCQTVAALATAVKQGHDFAKDITYLGGNRYLVNLHGKLADQIVVFDGWTNAYDPITTNGEFWPVLMQRARLQALGLDPKREYTKSEWDAWNTKTGGRLYSIAEALFDYTGSYPSFRGMAYANPQSLRDTLARGNYLVAQSSTGAYVTADGVIGNHAYAVVAVYYDVNTWKVRLFNPWATDRENNTTIDAADKSHPAANDGFVTLTWKQFTSVANFKGYYVGIRK